MHNIAWHQFGSRQANHFPAANDRCFGGHRFRQCGNGLLGTRFLDITDDRVDQHHPKDHQRVGGVFQNRRHQAGDQQNDHQRVVELKQEAHQRAFALFGGQHVEAKALLTVFDLKNIQSLLDIRVQQVKNFVCRKMMPVFAKQGIHRIFFSNGVRW